MYHQILLIGNSFLLLVLSCSITSVSAASIEVETNESGTKELTCSVWNIVDMNWKVYYGNVKIKIDERSVEKSKSREVEVTEGITLTTIERSMRTLSTLRLGSDDGDRVEVTAVCSGTKARGGNTFRARETVIAFLPIQAMSGDSAVDLTTPSLPEDKDTLPEDILPEDDSNFSTSPAPTNNSSVPNNTTPVPDLPTVLLLDFSSPVGVLIIALGMLSILIFILITITTIVGCIVCKNKKKRKELPETLHHYDYVTNEGIYSQPQSTMPTTNAGHTSSGEQSDYQSQNIDMVLNSSYNRQNHVNTDRPSTTNLNCAIDTSSQFNMRINTAYNEDSTELSCSIT